MTKHIHTYSVSRFRQSNTDRPKYAALQTLKYTDKLPTGRDGLKAVLSRQRSRQRRGKAAMSLTEARQDRELEAEARQTKFEARPRRFTPENPPSPRCIAVPNLVALSQTV